MIGAIAGDIIGSIYERNNIKTKDFPLFTDEKHFTDDTAMQGATIDKLLNNKTYIEVYQQYGRRFPDAGYGKMFKSWVDSDSPKPYDSYGNGSAMRVCPVGLFYTSYEDVLRESTASSCVTHNHPEAVNAAHCVAEIVRLAAKNAPKHFIKNVIEEKFGYDMSFDLDKLRKTYSHDVKANGTFASAKTTMPVALKVFLMSYDFEDCIRLAVSMGGDTDTIACIAGAFAEAYYKKIPKYIIEETWKRIPKDFQELLLRFYSVATINTLADNAVELNLILPVDLSSVDRGV